MTFSHFHLSIGTSFPLESRTPLSLICNQNPLSLTSPQISVFLSLLPNTSHLVSLLLQRLDFAVSFVFNSCSFIIWVGECIKWGTWKCASFWLFPILYLLVQSWSISLSGFDMFLLFVICSPFLKKIHDCSLVLMVWSVCVCWLVWF